MAPESMTHSEDEEETRHVFGLPYSMIAVTGVDGDCNIFGISGTWRVRLRRIGLTDQMPQ